MKVFSFFINFFRHVGIYSGICFLMSTGSSYGFIYKLDQWNNGNQNIYCLSDTKISTKYSQKQLSELAQFAGARDARVIVEDMLDYSGKDTRIKAYLDQLDQSVNQKEFLLGSVDYLKDQGISREKIQNVEYRHAANAAIDGNVSLSANDVMEPAYNEYHKGWKYRDKKTFDQYYKSKLQDYRRLVLKPCRSLFFYMYWRSSQPLADVLSKAGYYKALDSIVSLFDGNINQDSNKKFEFIIKNHGKPLLNIKMARAIAQALEKNVIVCASADSIQEVNTVLCDAGYQCVQSKLGTVRIGPKSYNAPRALKLRTILQKSETIINTKVITNQSEQLRVCSVSKEREERQKKEAAQDMNLYLFFAALFLVFFAFFFFFYQCVG